MNLENKNNVTYGDRPVSSGMDQAPPILEDILCKIISLCNHIDNNNCLLCENTQQLKETLRRAVGIAEDYEKGGIPLPSTQSDAAKEPTHLTFRMRKALDILSDMLDKNYTLLSAQSRTINEFNQLA